MASKKVKKVLEPEYTDIIFRERKDGKLVKVWLNKGKRVRRQIVEER